MAQPDFFRTIDPVAIDRQQLPDNVAILQQMVVDLTAQLNTQQQQLARTEHLLQQLLRARYGRHSEQLSPDQLALFAAELAAQGKSVEELRAATASDDSNDPEPPAASNSPTESKPPWPETAAQTSETRAHRV